MKLMFIIYIVFIILKKESKLYLIIILLNDLIKQKFLNFNIKFVKLNKRINEDLEL